MEPQHGEPPNYVDDELVTPSLHRGDILEGVTRRSVLELARDQMPELNLKVSERDVGESWWSVEE